MLILLSLLSCKPATVDDTGEPEPFVSTLPVSECGLQPYEWQSAERLGEIVDWEHQEMASMTAESLSLLLETLGLEMFSPVPYGIDVYRIRYLTQDRGELIESTGLVAFPKVEEAQSFPTLLWVRPTVGFSDDCAPSGGQFTDQLAHTVLASFGYVVVAPDLLGMNGFGEPAPFLHPYIVAEPTAVAALDSVRALWRFQDDEGPGDILAEPEARALFWGGSEGGFGAIWADRYATGYAPEIEVEAVIASVPPTDLMGLAHGGVVEYNEASEGLVAVLGTSRLWYGETVELDTMLLDEDPVNLASRLEEGLATSCSGGENPLSDAHSVEEIYQPSFIEAVTNEDWAAVEPWSCYLQTSTLVGSAIPRGTDAPVFYQVSEDDELVLGYTGRADAPRLCDDGYELEYMECAGADHVSGAAESLPYQIEWAAARMAGEPLEDPCVMHEPIDCSQFVPEGGF